MSVIFSDIIGKLLFFCIKTIQIYFKLYFFQIMNTLYLTHLRQNLCMITSFLQIQHHCKDNIGSLLGVISLFLHGTQFISKLIDIVIDSPCHRLINFYI